MATRIPPTQEQLERTARQQLSWEALCLLDSLGHRGRPVVFHRAFGELFNFKSNSRSQFHHPMGMHDAILHTRVIADFLLCSSECINIRHADDIEAGDYLSDWEGVDVFGSEHRETINKSVVHLSRTRPERDVMPVSERKRLGTDTLKALRQFIEQVPPERTDWFEDLREALDSASL